MLAALLVAMLIAGLNYNSNLALAFAFLMVSLALVAMHHCHRNLQDLGVDVNAEADASAGGVAGFDFVLRNGSRVARYDIEIHCCTESQSQSKSPSQPRSKPPSQASSPSPSQSPSQSSSPSQAQSMSSVAAGAYERVTVRIPVARRGVMRLNQFELRTRYPFGWFRAWTYAHTPLTVFVAPEPRGDRALPAVAAAMGMAARSEMRGDEEFAGLRPYEPGVALKHMAWKVLARGGDAAVRSYTGLSAQPEWLEWSSLPSSVEVEMRLSQLCRWVLQSEAAQRPYGLRIPGKEIAPSRGAGHRSACLRALALYAVETPR